MKSLFPGHYRPTESEFKTLSKQGVVALDTNILLNIYRYPQSVRKDFLQVLQKVGNRLWIPHHVAVEFQANRLEVISDQVAKFAQVRTVIANASKQLRTEITNLQLHKKHSSINPEQLLARVEEEFKKFSEQLDILEKDQPDVFAPDALREQLDKLLEDKVGPRPTSQAELDKIYEVGKKRFEQQRPPGFRDIDKGRNSKQGEQYLVTGDLVYRREYSDLLIWLQIMEYMEKSDAPGLIFVTDDEKADWWWIVESGGRKVIGPRPELVEEFRNRVGKKLFYAYNSDRFLTFAKQYLGADVDQDSIDQVGEIAAQSSSRFIHSPKFNVLAVEAEQAVVNWLQGQGGVLESQADELLDILKVSPEGDRTGYIIKYIRFVDVNSARRIRNVTREAKLAVNESGASTIVVVIATDTPTSAQKLAELIAQTQLATDFQLSAVVGILNSDATQSGRSSLVFTPTYSTGLG